MGGGGVALTRIKNCNVTSRHVTSRHVSHSIRKGDAIDGQVNNEYRPQDTDKIMQAFMFCRVLILSMLS